MAYFTPCAFDDWIFMAEWREVNGNQALSSSALFDFWKDIRLYDNGRLSNTFAPLFLMFSPWKECFPFITGILTAFIIAAIPYFSFGSRRLSPLYLALAWMACLFMLPWRNSLFVTDFALNYIWSAAITLLFMGAVLKFESKGWNIYKFIAVLLLAFIAGGWHEGFAFSTLGGFLVYTIVRSCKAAASWRTFSPQWYIVGFFYALIATAFYFCPGMLARTVEEMGGIAPGASLVKLVFDFLPVVFALLLIVFMWAVPSLRYYLQHAARNTVFIIAAGIVLTGTLLSVLFVHQPRSAFWPDLMAIVMLFILTRPVWKKLARSRFRNYIAFTGLCVCIIPMCYALTWQYRFFLESEEILSKINRSASGTAFHDIIPSSSIPMIALKIPNHEPWVSAFHYHSLKQFYGKPYPAVVPAELESADIMMEPQLLEGNLGALKVGNSLVLPYDTENISTQTFEITYSDGANVVAAGMELPFLSSSGNPMTYLLIYGMPVEDIAAISVIE